MNQLALLAGPQTKGPGEHYETGGFSARQIWAVIRRHRTLLFTVVAIVVGLTTISQLTATPVYESVALVQVELQETGDARPDEVAARNQLRVANEARTYRSRSLAEKVVRDLELLHDPRFMDDPLPENESSREALRQATSRLMSMLEIENESGSDFIEIKVQSPSPELSAAIANQYVDSMAERRQNQRSERRERLSTELEAERDRLARQVQEADRRLAEFRRANNMPVGAGSVEDYLQYNRIEGEAASARGMSAAGSARAAGQSRAAGMRTTSGATSSLLEQQQRRVDELINRRAQLSVTFGPGHPEVQQVDAELAELRSNMEQERARVQAVENARISAEAARERALAQSEAAANAARSGQLAGQLAELRSRIAANTQNAPELARLEGEAQIARDAYLAVAERVEAVRASLDSGGVNSSMVSPAVTSNEPVAPQPVRTVSAAFVGSLMLGFLLIYMIELFDNKLRTSEQMRRLFGLPTFGMLPEISGGFVDSPEDNPVTKDPQSLFAEVARSMHAEIADLPYEGTTQTVLITSPLPADGKSTVALSLVAAASAMGRRALLLDLDLRRPSILQSIQHHVGGPDLVDYLSGHVDTPKLLPSTNDTAPREIETHKPVVLSSREPVRDPASLIKAGRLQTLTQELRANFDLIVINGPATLAVRDARTLTAIADSTIMVVRWAKTTVEQMRASLQLLQGGVDAAVFNKVDYAEHARRGYGDSVEFYMDAASYYSGPLPRRKPLHRRVREFFESVRARIIP